ncbi:MAG: hypothetical protein KatS3mg131_3837 [Candidatus Tectimicrobiota bacterium]|nr:MAG: hypothetical protein KatS3mg131_3837 [Candidatus Tectomicrobia bacterium]
MDTNLGHLLVYGLSERVLAHVDIGKRMHDGRRLIAELDRLGAVAVPAHPFRESAFGTVLERNLAEVAGVRIIEGYNGQNRPEDNQRALALAERYGLRCVGGSDAHYLSHKWFLTCATVFEEPIASAADLVEALRYGTYRPLVLPAADGADLPGPVLP